MLVIGARRILVGPGDRRIWLLVAACSAIGVKVTYPIFFARTNAAVRSMLDRWATWHWIRTGLGIVGFIGSLRALQQS
jgi:hypothetical protein